MIIYIAHALNDDFQNDMDLLFRRINKKALFMRAPVKLEERCQIKVQQNNFFSPFLMVFYVLFLFLILQSQTDYNDRPYPTCAELMDVVRCSVTFNTCKELIDGLNKFVDRVKQGKAGCIKQIVRCKNGFKKYENLNVINAEKCGYVDVKLNVIIESKTGQKTAIIGEIQFLLKFFLVKLIFYM